MVIIMADADATVPPFTKNNIARVEIIYFPVFDCSKRSGSKFDENSSTKPSSPKDDKLILSVNHDHTMVGGSNGSRSAVIVA